MRTRIRWHSSQRTTSSAGAFAIAAEVGRGQLELAAAAAALPQRGRTDAALLRAEPLVEREQVVGHARRRAGALGGRPARPARAMVAAASRRGSA